MASGKLSAILKKAERASTQFTDKLDNSNNIILPIGTISLFFYHKNGLHVVGKDGYKNEKLEN